MSGFRQPSLHSGLFIHLPPTGLKVKPGIIPPQGLTVKNIYRTFVSAVHPDESATAEGEDVGLAELAFECPTY